MSKINLCIHLVVDGKPVYKTQTASVETTRMASTVLQVMVDELFASSEEWDDSAVEKLLEAAKGAEPSSCDHRPSWAPDLGKMFCVYCGMAWDVPEAAANTEPAKPRYCYTPADSRFHRLTADKRIACTGVPNPSGGGYEVASVFEESLCTEPECREGWEKKSCEPRCEDIVTHLGEE